MTDGEIRNPGWGESFARIVLASAVRGDLLRALPGAFSPELFGSPDRGPRSPRERIAEVVQRAWERYSAPTPVDVLAEDVRDAGAALGSDAERDALDAEFRAILAVALPETPEAVYDKVREWAAYRTMVRGVLQAADALQAGPGGVASAREILEQSIVPIEASDGRPRTVRILGDAEARLRAWSLGEEKGASIPTGFRPLDDVLGGGPTKRETFYFLAPPKGAKTACLLHVARAASRRRYGVYVATFEMQAMRMALRVDRGIARASREEIREDISRLETAFDGLRAAGAGEITIDEFPPQRRGAVREMRQRVREIRRRGGRVDVVIADYLNIMGAGTRREDEKRHELARISRELSTFAKEEDVLVYSAALVRRQAVTKAVIRKDDIAEAFEVIAVLDHGVAICGDKEMVQAGWRSFYVVASREERDEVKAGDYSVDFARMSIDPGDMPEQASDGEGA